MKNLIRFWAAFVLLTCSFVSYSQSKSQNIQKSYPNSFTISNSELNKLFKVKETKKVSVKNKYLSGSIVLINNSVGDNKQLKLQLKYFPNAHLIIQINGNDSKILYIASSDDSIFYNSKIDKETIIMTKCTKDDIVSE